MNVQDLIDRKNDFFIQTSSVTRGGIILCFLVGLIGLGAGVQAAGATRVWAALLLSTFFFFSIALGGIAFSGMQDVVGAVWGRPIKRIHEGFAAFLPAAGAVLILFLLCIAFDVAGARNVYPWMANPHMLDAFPGKNVWLTITPFVARDIFAIFVILGLSCWQLRTSVKRDAVILNGGSSEEVRQASLAARDRLRHWCAPILLAYALCYSLLGFDLLMSLAPTWFSTLWGGWLFAIMMQTLMATILIFLFVLNGTSIGKVYGRQQFHDIGKLMHGFTIFYAYLTYAHVLTYWYGNVPEETEYFIERLHGPWFWVVVISPFLNFVIPLYTLIFKAAKWTSFVAIPLALMILMSQWVVYALMVVPAVEGHHWKFALVDVAGMVLMLGMFLGSFLWFAKRTPMVGLGDALLAEALESGH